MYQSNQEPTTMDHLLRLCFGIATALLWTSPAPSAAQHCGSNCGELYDYPVFAKVGFNLNGCTLKDSWMMTRHDLIEVESFANADGVCTNNDFNWLDYEWHNQWEFNSLLLKLTNLDTCDGMFSFDFTSSSDDTSGTFHDAKVLCNSHEILTLLVRDPGTSRRDFQLYYETIALDELTSDYDNLSAVIPTETGKYCKMLFPLMTELLNLLKSSETAYDSLPSACSNAVFLEDYDDKETWIIVGSVVGGLLVVGLVVCLACCCRKKQVDAVEKLS